jgi:integrase
VPWIVHYEGKPVKKLRRSWSAAAARARVKATPHTMRHTRATMLMQAGIGMREAADFLGMSTEMLERVYGKFRPEWQDAAAEV